MTVLKYQDKRSLFDPTGQQMQKGRALEPQCISEQKNTDAVRCHFNSRRAKKLLKVETTRT